MPSMLRINLHAWHLPLDGQIWPTSDPESFKTFEDGHYGLPLAGHPGSFGHVRKNHIHEGIDLYGCPGQNVYAVESGTVVAIEDFTGTKATPPSPWWNDTQAVLIEGQTGVVVYGEIATYLKVGQKVKKADYVGYLVPVLKKNKGRPMTMLHLELHRHGTQETYEWLDEKPTSLRDPTPYLLHSLFDAHFTHF